MTLSEEEEVALKLVHTADWHLGKQFVSFEDADRRRLTRARLDVVDRILGVAEEQDADAILVAGDIFDEPSPKEQWWRGLADRLSEASLRARPILLLPGNHDPLTSTSVYNPKHPFRAALPAWVHVVDSDDFEFELGQDAVVYGRPCRSQAGQRDLALELPERQPGDQRIRIGLVHGQTFDIEGCQTNFPISKGAADARGLDYLAIGDTHAFRVLDDRRTVYPSAPESCTFGETDAGYVAVVFFGRRRRRPVIKQEPVAFWTWQERTTTDLASLRRLRDLEDLRQTVLRLTVEMSVDAAEYEETKALLKDLKGTEAKHGRAGILRMDTSGLFLNTNNVETLFAEFPPVLRATVARLKARADADDNDSEVARRALNHLYRLAMTAEPCS